MSGDKGVELCMVHEKLAVYSQQEASIVGQRIDVKAGFGKLLGAPAQLRLVSLL